MEVNGDSLTSRFGFYGSSAVDNYIQELTGTSFSSPELYLFPLPLPHPSPPFFPFLHDMTGFFVPPVSANYSFYTRGDDFVLVHLSTTSSPNNLTLIAHTAEWTYNWWTYGQARSLYEVSRQISKKIYCEAGKPYYFRILHEDTSGADWFDVAIRVHGEGSLFYYQN